MAFEKMRKTLTALASEYSLKRVTLFGSRADGTYHEESDIDLIIEFSRPVSLLFISALKCHLEDEWCLNVNIVHGPIQEGDLYVHCDHASSLS